jgi:hypothetical protein
MRARLPDWSTPQGTALIAVLLVILGALLLACAPTPSGDSRETDAGGVSIPATTASAPAPADAVVDSIAASAQAVQAAARAQVRDVEQVAGDVIAPAAVQVAVAATESLPAAEEPKPAAPSPVSPAAVDLIVRQEIISPAYYDRKLQGFACPGDRSGPTCGIGSDLGVHTPTRIRADWSIHPQVGRLVQGSGKIGFAACRAYRAANADVRTPFALAEEVFATRMLPAYHALAARTFADGWDSLPPNAQGALVATVYVRGASMRDAPGSHMRTEMRQLRDECVPAGDVQCIARAHLAMCQRFAGRADAAGLCNRFRATAALAVQA